MSINIHNFIIKQGETFVKSITWNDVDGDPVNLTDYTARMHLRRKFSDDSPALILTTENSRIAITALTGVIVLNISATDTASLSGNYIYDLELISGTTVKRLLQGTIKIDPEVTK